MPRRPSRAGRWRNWSGLAGATPQRVLVPRGAVEVAEAVVDARAAGLPVKLVGSGHSFTDVAATGAISTGTRIASSATTTWPGGSATDVDA